MHKLLKAIGVVFTISITVFLTANAFAGNDCKKIYGTPNNMTIE